jgi:hypothetical protein
MTPAGEANALAQLLLKLTSPGVPDVYQGTESWDLSLVDPDNRRPVDWRRLEGLLAGAAGAAEAPAKIRVMAGALALRREDPGCSRPASTCRSRSRARGPATPSPSRGDGAVPAGSRSRSSGCGWRG